MSTLTKIIIKQEANGKWSCTRQRRSPDKEGGGESASGFNSLEEVFAYIRAHDNGGLLKDQKNFMKEYQCDFLPEVGK